MHFSVADFPGAPPFFIYIGCAAFCCHTTAYVPGDICCQVMCIRLLQYTSFRALRCVCYREVYVSLWVCRMVCVVWYISIFVPSISPSLTLTCLGRAGVLLRYICDRVIFYDFSIFYCIVLRCSYSLFVTPYLCYSLHTTCVSSFFTVVGHV